LKNVTIIGINYFPEDTAIGKYSTQMAKYLALNGYKISVITGFPYYPFWEIKNNYKDKPTFHREIIDNITVYRYKQFVPKNPTFIKRIWHLFDFTFGAFINSFKIKQADLVIVIVPFTATILVGWLLKKRLKAKLWIHIQDFEFDAAKQTGISKRKNDFLFRGLFNLEKYLLNKSDVSSSISNTMLEKLKNKTTRKIVYFPNWVEKEANDEGVKKQLFFFGKEKFKILYSGNIGEKQDWLFFIDFLNNLKKYSDIEVCIVGHGSKKAWLEHQTKSFPFVKMYPPVPLNNLKELLGSADLHILFQKDEVLDTVMPSKILGMMASGKPSLITGYLESEVSKIIKESEGGIYLSNNIKQLIKAFDKLYLDTQVRLEMGTKAKGYIVNNYAHDNILSKFEKEIQILLNTTA
jgi:putative colanic acid biosynthesis glycosyltransferase WcaI